MIRSILFMPLLSLAVAGAYVPSVSSAAQSAAQDERQTVTLEVQNMTCRMCPITVRKALKQVPGVIEASVDYDAKTATVTFDPARTNVKALTRATTNAGYPSAQKHE